MKESLKQMAIRLFPDWDSRLGTIDRSEIRSKWVRAVQAVRKTKRGWVRDRMVKRVEIVQFNVEKKA
jgi:hypothetical protein